METLTPGEKSLIMQEIADVKVSKDFSADDLMMQKDDFKIELDNLIVLHDELDLEYGDIRIKQGGGDNGHNGLKSIRNSLDSGEYIRIRLGIGRPPGEMDPADFVLKPFNFFEKSKLTEFLNMGNKAISDVVNYGVSQAQNLNNG